MDEANKKKLAQDAFLNKDPEESTLIHKANVAKETHSGDAGEYISSIVFGGLDGIITTFAVVSAATGSHLTRAIILIVGFANLLGDAVGMAVGDYVSTKAEMDHMKAERAREQWEMDNCLDEEKREMIEIYQNKGLSLEEATEVVGLLLENPKVFLEVMMVEELGLLSAEEENPLKGAAITFGSFMVFGGLPMLSFLCAGDYNKEGGFDLVYIMSAVLFAIALFALGAIKGKISKKRWYITGLTTLFNGAVTTGISYALGTALEHVV